MIKVKTGIIITAIGFGVIVVGKALGKRSRPKKGMKKRGMKKVIPVIPVIPAVVAAAAKEADRVRKLIESGAATVKDNKNRLQKKTFAPKSHQDIINKIRDKAAAEKKSRIQKIKDNAVAAHAELVRLSKIRAAKR